MPAEKRNAIPELFTGLVDDAAVFPPGNASLPDAITAHIAHRASWYQNLVGPLLLPVSKVPEAFPLIPAGTTLNIGLIADTGIEAAAATLQSLPGHVIGEQIEAKITETDTIDTIIDIGSSCQVPIYAEMSLTDELDKNLSLVGPTTVMPKFRTGGLTPDMFPSPAVLAAAIVGCAEAGVSFKLTAGLHHLVRHTDHNTGFTHHGFGNILNAADSADNGGTETEVSSLLKITDPESIRYSIRGMLTRPRPLWVGFGSCSIAEPLDDLIERSLVYEES